MCKHMLLIFTNILWCLSGSKLKVLAKSFILCGVNCGPETWSHIPKCAQLVQLSSSSSHLPLSELLQDTTLASDSCIQSTQFRHTVYPAKQESWLSLRKNSLNWCFGALKLRGGPLKWLASFSGSSIPKCYFLLLFEAIQELADNTGSQEIEIPLAEKA